MKYIKKYELAFPFFNKNKKIEEEPVVKIPITDMFGNYRYNGKKYTLKEGDYTNKGYIAKITSIILNDHNYPLYLIGDKQYSAYELILFKGDIDLYLDVKYIEPSKIEAKKYFENEIEEYKFQNDVKNFNL